MTPQHDQSSDWLGSSYGFPSERGAPDEDVEPLAGWEAESSSEWRSKWAPACPDGNPQQLRRALGFRERSVGELELRVALGGNDGGVCQVIVDEHQDEVYVRVLVCQLDDDDDDDDEATPRSREYMDCPVRVWLERPLGERAVIDFDSDEELPLFTPAYLNNVPQPDHGYSAARRRRPRRG